MNKIKIIDVTDANFDLIPRPITKKFNCQECFYWIGKKDGRLDQKLQKRKWLQRKAVNLGSLNKVLYVQGVSEPIGFIQFGPIKEFETAKLFYAKSGGWPKDGWCVTCLTIKPEHRRQGLAQLLIKAVIRDLKKRHVSIIDAYPALKTSSLNETSAGTIPLWQKLGFRVIAEGSLEVIMRKELANESKTKNPS